MNQIEIHPFYQRGADLELCKEYNIQPQGWGPFAEGKNGIFTNEVLSKIAKAHNKSVPQLILRWELQRGVQIIPKTLKEERARENINIFDFELTQDEMNEIAKLDEDKTLFIDHRTTDAVKLFSNWKIHD